MPNSKVLWGLGIAFASAALTGCSKTVSEADLPVGPSAYTAIGADSIEAPIEYQISPTDVLALTVFDEPQLTNSALRVDDSGNVQIPLVGQIKASGLSAMGLSTAVATRLKASYLVNPKVNVSVVMPAKRYVSVEGEVTKPGVYEISNDFTLLAALASAESPTDTAKLDQVIVLRTIGGKEMAARFNIKDIRAGIAPNPQILDKDVIVVGFSKSNAFWVNLLKAAPLFNAFVLLGREF